MWKIKEVKKNGKKNLKNNLWTLILVGIFMTLIVGEYLISKDGFSNLEIVDEIVKDKIRGQKIEFFNKEDKDVIVNKYIDRAVSQLLSGNMTGTIKNYNETHNVTKGVIFTVFNVFTNGQLQLQKLMNSISDYTTKLKLEKFLVMIVAIAGLLLKIFISNPILISESRIYLESINYKKTKITRLMYSFRRERYLSIVKSILVKDIYKFLWNLTIVGGLIKNYSYKMVTYIVAENPQIKAKDAIKMSEKMMDGNKFKAFKLDCSFLGWYILEYITFGFAGIYVNPYNKATYTELYRILREEYIKNKNYDYEQLNDSKLFYIQDNKENNDNKNSNDNKVSTNDEYPDLLEIEKKKIKINYDKNYELTSIILFFFVFSFVGWLWEVGLYIFQYGIFVNRGTMYGPWLPIYGVGCTIIILLTKFKTLRKILKNPFLTFNVITLLCSIIEYFTSWYIEVTSGMRYWDYTGVFLNLNGRICLEGAIFFGLGGCICVYIVAPFLERLFQKITAKLKLVICTLLVMIFSFDSVYSNIHPHVGEGITSEIEREKYQEK